MTRILDEMLDLARIEARRGSDFELQDLSLAQIVEAVLADHCAPEGRVEPRWQAPQGEGAALGWARVDSDKLQRALRNLLSNAYKYSPDGGEVSLRLVHDADGGRVGIEVEDQGIGMTPEQLARVGERFYRADNSGRVLGTGLGVSLVREVATLHGGSLALYSEAGRGTVATLWLPQLRARPAAAQGVLQAA